MNSHIQTAITEQGIEAYLHAQQHKSLLRFLTCGSVDDGKSTLIGRLLHDSQQIYEDQLKALESDSQKLGTTGEKLDLALLVDGLQAEREQGITIDVAYRYFSTAKRKFIISDTPGHEQYTRNMATGASTCDLAIILIDARKGVLDQTRRHSFIASLLGIKQFVVAVNKMDLVEFSQEVFERISADYREFAKKLSVDTIHIVPVSALDGDNVVNQSDKLAWYEGETLLALLESAEVERELERHPVRLPVQYVNRPNLDFRGFAGTLASGILRVGDKLAVLPSGKESTVTRIVTFDGDLEYALPGQAITVTFADEIDISRGDLLVDAAKRPQVTQNVLAHIVWMGEESLQPGRVYDVKLATKKSRGQVEAIRHRIEINKLDELPASELKLNEIGLCELSLTDPVAFDPYQEIRDTGSFILIDRLSNVTVGAGMIVEGLAAKVAKGHYSEFEIELNALVRKHFPHWQALAIGNDTSKE
ncbi:sulfate adenylyltransferase subunit CysN [Aeromonas veronii]|uniref:sulfate adenylyltransferase subunit CysN n=1 Tax=Aeromonas veronii TaxID=654 RepID=UPI0018816C49|nr:sulfate adenylyltransferase subunit CysN [Aeromonas veronii]MBE8734812.1 sulfate adenylyltransferase subunit CysN [Aeromonas veronii]MBE8739109.1 sulfate adenylyltransferase subunit CysN [Aeromonas veronii]MBE8745075.1 sulfate adenylyltransferase subunit CysN [Aeromonas veronii]MBE8763880.1 sulfate adenylyltransferase subunit CysN [Aeromonas veronii]MBE8840872.1 sulfate adenylyltransferase subunit CysN [Aeromonas veronii]